MEGLRQEVLDVLGAAESGLTMTAILARVSGEKMQVLRVMQEYELAGVVSKEAGPGYDPIFKLEGEETNAEEIATAAELQQEVIDAIKRSAGTTRERISDQVGIDQRYTSWLLARLEEDGQISCIGEAIFPSEI